MPCDFVVTILPILTILVPKILVLQLFPPPFVQLQTLLIASHAFISERTDGSAMLAKPFHESPFVKALAEGVRLVDWEHRADDFVHADDLFEPFPGISHRVAVVAHGDLAEDFGPPFVHAFARLKGLV